MGRGTGYDSRNVDGIEGCERYMGTEISAKEVRYKMADHMLKKMQESGLINQEEYDKIRLLNMETFMPEMACLYA